MTMGQDIDIARLCELANLELSPDKTESFREQLGAIVKYVGKLAAVDVAGIASTVYGCPATNVFREDRQGQSLDREVVLKNAPQRIESEIRVPRIVE